jgi:protein gp37
MFRDKERFGQDPTTVVRSKDPTFFAPLKWKEPQRVFACSWSDFFHPDADQWRDDAWRIIATTQQHTYLILTKRPERIIDCVPWARDNPSIYDNMSLSPTGVLFGGPPRYDPWPHVWIGTSVESMRWIHRLDELARAPVAHRFVSAEPLLGCVSVLEWLASRAAPLEWVIVGGESGPDARPMEMGWARKIRNECAHYGVPFFLKQLGGWPDARSHERAVLDGREYKQTPWNAAIPNVVPS